MAPPLAASSAAVPERPAAAVAAAAAPEDTPGAPAVRLPRVVIRFCTQCKWMLRAAYFAQELLSTFGQALGEVALQPETGGVFTVTIETAVGATGATEAAAAGPQLLWDRKAEGGFPETKELKRRVRDVIAPGRDLGHVDRVHAKDKAAPAAAPATPVQDTQTTPVCEDCQ